MPHPVDFVQSIQTMRVSLGLAAESEGLGAVGGVICGSSLSSAPTLA
jgi:hypothetical protein